jgi:hypothetical protein
MNSVRLGLVRCDTHGYYYGAMLDRCDPSLLQKHNYVVHHYFSSIYDPTQLTMPRVGGFQLAKVFDDDPEKARSFSETFCGKPQVCQTLDEMTDGIDAVFIADCDGGGADHLKLATPFLKKGIPTFVDKPFASTVTDAGAILNTARKSGAPVFSSSILSQVPAAAKFKKRLDEIVADPSWPIPSSKPASQVGLGVVKGVGGAFSQELKGSAASGGLNERLAYIIHGIALGLHLFGHGVEWVEAMGNLPLEYLHMHLRNGIEIIVLNTSVDIFPEECSFYAHAYSKYGAINSPPIGDPEFIAGAARIVRMFKKMVQTGKPPIPYDEIVEHIAVVEAGQISQSKGARVYLRDVMPSARASQRARKARLAK